MTARAEQAGRGSVGPNGAGAKNLGQQQSKAQWRARLTAARRALMEAHVAMAEAKLRVGVRTKLIGVSPTIAEDYSVRKMAVDNDRKTA